MKPTNPVLPKDPNYDRYAGVVSLPGDPLNPEKPRPFRVDEDGHVIYLDERQDVAGVMDCEKPVKVAELGNASWNGRDQMQEQGERDGALLEPIYNRVRNAFFPSVDPNAPPPPASGTYPVPTGTTASGLDPQHRFVVDGNGKLIENPAYKRAYGATETDKKGVAKDLAMIAGANA